MNEALRMQCYYPENKALMFANIQTRNVYISQTNLSLHCIVVSGNTPEKN